MSRPSNTPFKLIISRDGSAAAFTAVGMVAFLGMVALAVDIGMLLGSRTESQRAADSAARAMPSPTTRSTSPMPTIPPMSAEIPTRPKVG